MDVGRHAQAAAVPGLGAALVGHRLLVGDQLPASENLEQSPSVVLKNRDIDVAVIARQPAEPRVDGPAAAEPPRGTERRHQFGNAGDFFGSGGHRPAARVIGISKHRYSPYHARGMSARTYLCRSGATCPGART